MPTYDDYLRNSRVAADDAGIWDKMADEAIRRADFYRQKAEQRRQDSADYRKLADRELSEINKALEGIAA